MKAPAFYAENHVAPSASQKLAIALKIVHAYGEKVPTPDQLMRRFGMHRATAYRWSTACGVVLGARAPNRSCYAGLVDALRLAREFGTACPSIEAVRNRLGGSRSTVFRYRAAWQGVAA